jgi:hypothetical protein
MNHLIVTSHGLPTKTVLEIARITGIENVLSLEMLVDKTQQVWLRKKNTERWEIEDSFADKQELLNPLFKLLGFFDPVYPTELCYTYGLLLGDTVPGLQTRLLFLKELIDKGIAIEQFVLLTGQRFLTESEQLCLNSYLGYATYCMSEAEAFLLLFKSLGLKKAMFELVDTPEKYEAGMKRRPTTGDTAYCWLAKKPEPGACLALSSQPFLPYQQLTLREILPPEFSLEAAGPIDPETTTVAVYLDSLARWLYQELRLRNLMGLKRLA